MCICWLTRLPETDQRDSAFQGAVVASFQRYSQELRNGLVQEFGQRKIGPVGSNVRLRSQIFGLSKGMK